MIRSFHYAAFTALLETAVVRIEDRSVAAPWADAWYRWVSGAFLRKYLQVTAGAPFLPAPADIEVILDAQVLQKAFLELRGELDHLRRDDQHPAVVDRRARGAVTPPRVVPGWQHFATSSLIARGCCWLGSTPDFARARSATTSRAAATRSGGCSPPRA